jgi:hypothetical protein
MSAFQSTKHWLVMAFGLPRDALHIYVGLAVFLGVAALFRLSLRDWRPLLAVLLVAVAGEAWDLADAWRDGARLQWAASWHDLWNTIFWPLILFAFARWTNVLRR